MNGLSAVFCWNPHNYENVSHKISEKGKEKANGKKHNSYQSAKNSEASNNLSVLYRGR